MNYLITGATGLVGRSLVQLLIESSKFLTKPSIVRLLVRKKSSDTYRRQFLTWCQTKQIQIVEGDLERLKDVEQFVDVPNPENTVLIHCGAIFNFWQPYKLLYNVNVKGTERVLRIFHKKKIAKLIYLSSAVVYQSVKGNGHRGVVEDDPMGNLFRNNYERTKLLSELLIKNYIREYHDRRVTILRPAGIIGGASSTLDIFGRLFFGDLAPLPNGGRDKISLVDASDVARAILYFSNLDRGNGEEFNIAGFTPQLREFVRGLAFSFNKKHVKIVPIPSSLFKPLFYLALAVRRVKSAKEKSFLLPILFEKLGQDVWIDSRKIETHGYEFQVSLTSSLFKIKDFLRENPWYVEEKLGFAL